jgi:putative DNA methylase
MIPKECKRLAEVDFPIVRVGVASLAEKARRTGTPNQLHLWWAWRPLAACRSMLLSLLLPDPCDELCPEVFKDAARHILQSVRSRIGEDDLSLRNALMSFIADFSFWDFSHNALYISNAHALVKAAHGVEIPVVLDPFAGGGAIPLEAQRIGCDGFASDYNSVACQILKVKLQSLQRSGPEIADRLLTAATEVVGQVRREIGHLFPAEADKSEHIAFIWAKTVTCEAPNCGCEIPLVRSFWLSRRSSRRTALKYTITRSGVRRPPQIEFSLFSPTKDDDVPRGTVTRAKATCPACAATLAPDRVREQLSCQLGGGRVIFDERGRRTGGARLLAVVTRGTGEETREYRLPESKDIGAVHSAQQLLNEMTNDVEWRPFVPSEDTPAGGGSGAGRAFSIHRYGMKTFDTLFTARQVVTLSFIARRIAEYPDSNVHDLLALCLGKLAERNNTCCDWMLDKEYPGHLYTQQVIPASWDFAEAAPLGGSSGSFVQCVKFTIPNILATCGTMLGTAEVMQRDAADMPLPDESVSIYFTDPPYYDAVPYSDLSDFFFVWLKRALPGGAFSRDPFDPTNPLTPKRMESVQDEARLCDGKPKDKSFFERRMTEAFREGRRVLRDDGIGSVVFAHKTTEGWEALLSGLISSGWVVTASWPISTERSARMRAKDSAALGTSVHLICRPRDRKAPIGDWGDVLRELPARVQDWMDRLQEEGLRGADLVFACIGPALEIYSRYSKVVDAEEREIPLGGDPASRDAHLRGYLAYVWEIVGRTALERVLGTAESRAKNGGSGALEEDARLTALFLWTLQSTASDATDASEPVDEDLPEVEDGDSEETSGGKPSKGFSLIFDVVRRFAQPLGIHLDEWEGRIIRTEKGVVRMIPVSDRGTQLFGEDGADLAADRIEAEPKGPIQKLLFPSPAETAPPPVRGRRRRGVTTAPDQALQTQRGATTLDRVHAAMLLQASGRANALRALLKDEVDRGPDFVRLSNALSALYPTGSDEKRLVDAMLLAAPR